MEEQNSSPEKSTSGPATEWLDYEYIHYEKSSNWFWIVGLAGLLGIILSIVFKNFLLAIILLIGTLTVMLYGARVPELVHFSITNRGIKAKDDLYPFKALKSFSIKDDDYPFKLVIESDRLFMPHIIIPLGDAEPEEIRAILAKFLPEEPYEESLIDILADSLGF
ncbi:MAG: hypothetical protein A2589_00230 [Candidatus Vogelbacteria bacterium RIFOXYD1_FULL_46_19]|uniref:DUF5673 domain-containing protein n=1 Tax=Candidatus Vogelbacteria bacterium RIFOXYD1_FULL_46_19 TaxID=1802439 RepID=A0A1G2QI05_9BACT|nr:MAG: hypothetical protein A2589_00230 [Candidatus Vogelbacteria bacterium RIFOXYD1_FULL_46_19]